MGLDLYPKQIYDDDLSPDSFGDQVDGICTEINEACEGFGADEERLVKALGGLTPEKRIKVALRYPQMFDEELKDKLRQECGRRDFGTGMQFLAVDPLTAECDMLKKGVQGFGSDEVVIFSILSGRSNKDMELLKKKFFEVYSEDLGRVLDGELGGNFQTFVFNVLQAAEQEFDKDFHTEEKMEEDTKALYDMSQGQLGTDEAGLFKILCSSPAEYLEKLNLMYAEKYGFTLTKLLEEELGGVTDDAAIFMLGMKLKPYEQIAKLINRACAGLGTRELLLTCILIRYQSFLKEVEPVHIELYGKTIKERIEEETSGDYKNLLLEIASTAETL